MALSKSMKIGLGVAVAGAAFLWWKSSSAKTAAVAAATVPPPGAPTNAQLIANAAPQLIAAMQQAISAPVQSPTTASHP